MVLYGLQGNSLGLLYALASKFTVFSQVYSTTGKQVSPPSSPSAALANFLYQPTLCLMQNFSPITYPSKGIRWLLCECELVTILYEEVMWVHLKNVLQQFQTFKIRSHLRQLSCRSKRSTGFHCSQGRSSTSRLL